MNIICIAVLTLGINTWGYAYFDLGTLPLWASSTPENSTASQGTIIRRFWISSNNLR